MSEKHSYIEKAKDILDDLDRQIERLESGLADKKHDASSAYDTKVSTLKTKREQAARKLEDLQRASSDSWDTAVEGMELVIDDLRLTTDLVIDRFTRAVTK